MHVSANFWRAMAGCLLLGGAARADAADLAAGLAAYQRGDYATAERSFRPLAEDGESMAQAFLAEMYLLGQGVGRDEPEAARLFRLAAVQGHPGAQFKLARLYWHGRGVEQDSAQALHWMRRAAEAGNIEAQYAVAQIYDFGPLALRDAEEAERWYRKAAARGHPQARNRFRERERRELARLLAEQQRGVGKAMREAAKARRYQVQLGAYRDVDSARRGWSIVKRRYSAELNGSNLQILQADFGARGGVWFRLRTGPMSTRTEADDLCERLRSHHTDAACLVIESSPPVAGVRVAVVPPPG